jgi:hypothetical protein
MRTLLTILIVLILLLAGVLGLGVVAMNNWQPQLSLAVPSSAAAAPDVAVQISEDYLNFRIAREIAALHVQGLTSVLAGVRPGALVDVLVEGMLGLGPIALPGKAVLHTQLSVSGNKVVVSVQSIEVANVTVSMSALPASMRQMLSDVVVSVDGAIADTLKAEGLVVQAITTGDHVITVDLIRQ